MLRYTCLVAGTCCLLCCQLHGAEKPNVVLFLVDDMGWMDSGVYGSTYYETPNIDRLAEQGMRFTDAYAMPLCSPARASILSGKYSPRHRVTSASGHKPPQEPGASLYPESAAANKPWIYAESQNYLDPEEYTLAEAIRDAGYRTAHFGKWHLGLTEPYWPDKQGFDVAFHGKPDPGPNSYFSPYGFKEYQSFPDGPDGEYITDRITDEAVKFIEENRDRPFFLNLWHYGVHGPWGHKEAYTERFAQKKDPSGRQGNPIMASMLQSIDESLGRVRAKIAELELDKKTLFVFYSDNGGNIHSNTPDDAQAKKIDEDHPRYPMIESWRKWAGELPPTNNAPLRDGKGRLYEGGMRVPLVVVWPDVVPRASVAEEVVGPIDLYPTILDMLGVPMPEQQQIDGLSFAPVLKQTGSIERDAYFTWFPHLIPGAVVRQGDWKLIRRFEPTEEYPDGYELFNLREDLGESKNLAEEMPEKVKEMATLLDRWIEETGALVPKPNPDYDPATPTRTTSSRALGGWVPKGCSAEEKDGALVVRGEGRNPFLGISGLKHAGPVTVHLSAHGAGGPARIQWRTATQDTFPEEGQSVEFSLPGGDTPLETTIELPVDGSLFHLRLYLPAQSAAVMLDAIEMQPARGKTERWEFDEK